VQARRRSRSTSSPRRRSSRGCSGSRATRTRPAPRRKRSLATSKAVGEKGKVEEAEIGDPDPVRAIEDALRTFPADELIIVTRSGEDASWLEQGSLEEARERFRLPTTHLVLSGPG
jgi:hypothetical protein